MVRFIILSEVVYLLKFFLIYIPIWLDLLSLQYPIPFGKSQNLHSNMVRFIIKNKLKYIMCGE